jgi:hypothetical protein
MGTCSRVCGNAFGEKKECVHHVAADARAPRALRQQVHGPSRQLVRVTTRRALPRRHGVVEFFLRGGVGNGGRE